MAAPDLRRVQNVTPKSFKYFDLKIFAPQSWLANDGLLKKDSIQVRTANWRERRYYQFFAPILFPGLVFLHSTSVHMIVSDDTVEDVI